MQATLKRTTVDTAPGMLPSVAYDQASSQIIATVIVSKPADSKEPPSVQAPIIVIPGATTPWKLVWRIQADTTTLEWAYFARETGVQLPESVPAGVEVSKSGRGSTEDDWRVDEWHATIINQTTKIESFTYSISVITPPIFADLKPTVLTIHDPTIVVTPEPMGGVD